MKAVYFVVVIFVVLVASVGLLNLASLFDEQNCVCQENVGQCQLYQEIDDAGPRRDYVRTCDGKSCKFFFGRCYKLHRYLDITYVIRGK